MKSSAAVGKLCSTETIALLRKEIDDAGGNEVFFVGTTDDARRVVSVRVAARGNASQVPAFFHAVDQGDVVIHNHPGGNLTPSNADLSLAGSFGEMSVGFYIIDNAVERVYVAVPAYEKIKRTPLDEEGLRSMFTAGSELAHEVGAFEVRPQQSEMMEVVTRAFNENKVSLIEAGTGVGKTLAYLVPAAIWSTTNKERVVVSTHTINLQEQIIEKDIPVLQKAVDENLSAALLKGRSNYVCRRKLKRIEITPELFVDESAVSQVAAIAEWAHATHDGSRSELPFSPSPAAWNQVAAESDFCLRARCDHFTRCFVQQARRKAATANILIVNHHLLFADMSVRKQTGSYSAPAVLPAYRRLIVDEAHNIEDVATSYLGRRVTRQGLAMTLGRLVGRQTQGRHSPRGLLIYLQMRLGAARNVDKRESQAVDTYIENRLIPAIEECRDVAAAFFDAVADLVENTAGDRRTGNGGQLRVTDDVRALDEFAGLRDTEAAGLVETLGRTGELIGELAKRVDGMLDEDDMAARGDVAELAATANRLTATAAMLNDLFCAEPDTAMVYWFESRKGPREPVSVNEAPLDVAEELATNFYPRIKTVVMTSATLSVGAEFQYIEERIGLDHVPAGRYESVMLDSPFDYQRQAIVGIPNDLPAPNERRFAEETASLAADIMYTTGGRAFVLFTSFGMLDKVYDQVAPVLAERGIRTLRQGSRPRRVLLSEFRDDATSVLFGTDSFWAGVDVEGDALQCVVITRLPFRVPTEPVQAARAELIKERGGNPFMNYTVPQAVIKFRQGFGRLIRRKTDRGAVLIFDGRILTKYYGRLFLKSLPPARVVQGTRQQILDELNAFWRRTVTPETEG
ncbi:MAG: DEAD/DEAH box helicase [Candidatus Hydrogenedentes bacterium]|nr:DEAD/DEAH box helicase [Candidatus Hydrogenedentota bacterium]